MRKPMTSLPSRFFLLVQLAALGLSLASCEARGPFGLPEARFRDLLAAGNREGLLRLTDKELEDPGPAGARAWYFTALWLEKGGALKDPGLEARRQEILRRFYEEAGRATKGFVREDAWLRYLRSLESLARAAGPEEGEGAWNALLTASLVGPASQTALEFRLEALAGLGRWEELHALAEGLLHDDLGTPSAADGALLYARALSAYRFGLPEAGPDLAELLSLGGGPWVAKALELGKEEGAKALVPELLVSRARLFQAVEARDYGTAWWYSRDLLPELRKSPTRELVGAVGKAWLFSGKAKEGIALMDSIGGPEGAPGEGGSPTWTAAFYKARMEAATGRYEEAAALLGLLAQGALDDKDRDSCLWYALDARLKALDARAPALGSWSSKSLRDRALALPRLEIFEAAAGRWHRASDFGDLVEPYFRDLVVGGDWNEVDAVADRLAPFSSPALAARLLYVSGRARELHLVLGPPSRPIPLLPLGSPLIGPADGPDLALASLRYHDIQSLAEAPEYYLLAASARLGMDLQPWTLKPRGAGLRLVLEAPPSSEDLAGTARGLVDFGLPALAWDLVSRSGDAVDDEGLLGLAKESAKAGSYVSSMRFANSLVGRSDLAYDGGDADPSAETPSREVFEILYPRPWKAELETALEGSDIPLSAAFGLIRSESWFDPGVQSGAGAVGLSQLMPSTAEEIARKLKVKDWSIVDPGDNLRLGMAMLHDLFDENDGHILRAAFAYNAGRSRLRRWLGESGGYPDDLFLERLSIAETRDYGRKILAATAWYAALYEGKGSAETVRSVFAGFPTRP